jgi:hypothetical protein
MERIVIKNTKSHGIAILLLIVLGPIGLFYSSILGGIVMTLIIPVIIGYLFLSGTIPTSIFGIFIIIAAIIYYIVLFTWSVISINKYNNRVSNTKMGAIENERAKRGINIWPIVLTICFIAIGTYFSFKVRFNESKSHSYQNVSNGVEKEIKQESVKSIQPSNNKESVSKSFPSQITLFYQNQRISLKNSGLDIEGIAEINEDFHVKTYKISGTIGKKAKSIDLYYFDDNGDPSYSFIGHYFPRDNFILKGKLSDVHKHQTFDALFDITPEGD